MVIFHSYVSLPEGIYGDDWGMVSYCLPTASKIQVACSKDTSLADASCMHPEASVDLSELSCPPEKRTTNNWNHWEHLRYM